MRDLIKDFWMGSLLLVTLLYAGGRASGQNAPVAPSQKASGQNVPAAPSPETAQLFREMQQVEDRWSDAIGKRDQYALELVLAPQFIDISATGDVTTRNQQVATLFVRGAEPISLDQKVVSARFVGNIAIVNGTYTMHWKLDKGPVDEKGIFSHVFEHTGAGWLCLNAQRTVVSEQEKTVAEKEKSKPKTSNAVLPLHVPLIYKGPTSTQPPPAPGTGAPQN
jgi:Domain of unknown function (DUF4440)